MTVRSKQDTSHQFGREWIHREDNLDYGLDYGSSGTSTGLSAAKTAELPTEIVDRCVTDTAAQVDSASQCSGFY